MYYLVNNSLATAYFETKQYIKAVEKGRECFKFKPTKSQVHGRVHFNSFCSVLNRDDQCKVSFIWSGTLQSLIYTCGYVWMFEFGEGAPIRCLLGRCSAEGAFNSKIGINGIVLRNLIIHFCWHV